jgi:hypothetical protein
MGRFSVEMIGDKQLVRQLKRLDSRVSKTVLKKTARKALKPAVRIYKAQIQDSDEVFAVYRGGRVYAEIIPGQLKRSIGIKFPRTQSDRLVASVGPRKTGAYSHPEKGGWFAGFISFGWLTFRDGTSYNGPNFNWSIKALETSKRFVLPLLARTFEHNLNVEIKKLGFTQKIGLK